jgi:hypothetical protein
VKKSDGQSSTSSSPLVHSPHTQQHPSISQNTATNNHKNNNEANMFSRIAYSHLSSAKRLMVTARKVGRSTQRSFLGVARADAEVMRSGLAPLKRSRFLPMLGGVAVASAIGQYYYGDQPDFYDYRFICDKDPDDLADFYGSENFMVCMSRQAN